MTQEETQQVKELLSQGKSMKEIIEIMRKRKENPFENLLNSLSNNK